MVSTTAALAGELSITGSAKATYSIRGSESASAQVGNPQGIGIANEFTLSASGELDNGMAWTYAQDIDGATVQDDAAMSLNTPFGLFKACVHECGLSANLAFDNSVYGAGSDYGMAGTSAATTSAGDDATNFTWGTNISSYNNVQFHTPADLLPFGITVKVGYAPEMDGTMNSSNAAASSSESGNGVTQYRVDATPIDGLTLSASYLEIDDAKADSTATVQGAEHGGVAVKYAFGPATIGYGKFYVAPTLGAATAGTARVIDYENSSWSIGVAANDNLSFSYNLESSDENNKTETVTNTTTRTTTEFEIRTIQAAYTMGGMTLTVANKKLENMDYTDDKDAAETVFSVSMAF
jgi:hypothetical protein